jgi:hypothetical protein
MSKFSDKTIATILWVLLGSILGWGVSALFSNLSNLPLWLFVLTSISTLVTFSIILLYTSTSTRHSTQNYNAVMHYIEKTQAMLDECLKQRAQIIPRESIYPEMANVIRNAKETVAVVTYFMYDWNSKKRTFLPNDQEISGLEDFYEAIYECINRNDVEYLRVWQVPAKKKSAAYKILCENPLHKKEIELIQAISRHHPDLARFIITDQHTTASYILVDRKNLFFNVDFYNTEEGVWYSPYMIFIKDATENAFASLNSIIVRLTSRVSNWPS